MVQRKPRILTNLLGIDPRSLALFRILVAAILLVDLATRSIDFVVMYTDEGFFPVQDARTYWTGTWRWSLHTLQLGDYSIASEQWYQATLFSVAGLGALLLAFGCFTRIATVVSWVLLASLHARQPLVLNAGDYLLVLLLFWSMFLPLGRVWSLDALRRRPAIPARHTPVVSVATLAIMAQICFVYFFSGLSKWNEFWLSGEALDYVYRCDAIAKPLAKTLLESPGLLQWLSRGTLGFELLWPLLLFVPWKTQYIRLAILVGFVGFHVGIELTMTLVLFPFISLAAWCVFLPGVFWDWLSGSAPDHGEPSPGDERRGAPRGWVGLSPTVNSVCALLLAGALFWNIFYVFPVPRPYNLIPGWLYTASDVTVIHQQWHMFDKPFVVDWWFVYSARLRNGTGVDLLRGGQPSSEKPGLPDKMFRRDRWRLVHQRFTQSRKARHQARHLAFRLADYLGRRWNEQHDEAEQVVVLEVLEFLQRIERDTHRQQTQRTTFARVEFGTPEETSVLKDGFKDLRDGDLRSPVK